MLHDMKIKLLCFVCLCLDAFSERKSKVIQTHTYLPSFPVEIRTVNTE